MSPELLAQIKDHSRSLIIIFLRFDVTLQCLRQHD
jgi:hypothetical protein